MSAPNDDFLTKSTAKFLDSIKSPADLRRVNARDLQQVADELRAETIMRSQLPAGIWEQVSA